MDGVAQIKSEFILKRSSEKSLENTIIVTTEKRAVETCEESHLPEASKGAFEKTEKRKKKERGQNKKRPRTVPKQAQTERLCPSLSRDNSLCPNEEKCQFLHDVQEYIKSKPDDIGQYCVNFALSGRCKYGLECRFANCHISQDFRNIVVKEKFEQSQSKADEAKMAHHKEVQMKLRKKQYAFPKSERFIKTLANDAFQSETSNHIETVIDGSRHDFCNNGSTIKHDVQERKKVDFSNKLYLAPLTTGQQSEWALIRRHESEDVFGVQLCGSFPDTMSKCAEMLSSEVDIDFIDVNIGCPIDLVFKKGGGCALMGRQRKLQNIVKGMVEVSSVPITVKMRTGIYEKSSTAHEVIPRVRDWGASLVTLHGRSREQRYTRHANWDYIEQCATAASPMPLYGNGDILSFEDANLHKENANVAGLMIARGALIKPWIFTEIKEQRHWDISAAERLDILRRYTNYGLEHWGSDTKGVENTRRFLLEWLSFLHRYIPVGLLEVVPQKINARPPLYVGRNDLETLMASSNCADWIKISEMLLGPVPQNFGFLPKHKANSYN